MLLALAVALGAAYALTSSSPAAAAHNANIAEKGATGGWLDGETVTFKYSKQFFCKQPPASAADSGCEVGAEPQFSPRPGANLPVLYVMTPLGIPPR